MALLSKTLRLTRVRRLAANPLSEDRGNVLIYVVLLMVIFGLLGVAMVSLFSTSISSSSTRNDTRRSFYMAESGIRYGVNQLRSKDFESKDIDDLNTTTFKLPPLGEFKINVFGPWFESPSNQSLSGSGSLNLRVTEGKIPSDFLSQIPTGDSNFRLVNRDYINFDNSNPNMRFRPPETGIAQVLGFTEPIYPFTSFQLNLADDFVVARGEEVCLSIRPTAVQDVTVGGNFKLPTAARNIFPRLGGTFEIRKRNFSYREAREITGGIELRDIQPVSGETSVTEYNIQTDEGIILTSRNHMVTAEGKYGDVVYPATASFAAAIADRSVVKAKSRKPDIEFAQEEFLDSKLNQVEPLTNKSFIDVDNATRSLSIGGGTGPPLGAVWFRDTRSIGGYNRFCQETGFGSDQNLGCFFNEGIRVFFTLEYAGSGDGLVFALMNGNPAKNDFLSAGGDIERSEMLGYAGDSRLSVTGTPPPDPPFLDNSGPARGLIPPKIGLEFDTKVNYSPAFESTGAYCASTTSLNENTRNDPGTPAADNRDAVQFVYWGASALRAQCRDNNPLYDDNRHEAYGTGDPNWIFDTFGAIQSSPLVVGNGTIYVGSDSTNFFAVNPDGTEKWRVSSSGPWFSPTVTGTGRIYVGTGTSENRLYAIRDDGTSGTVLWSHPTGGAVRTKPAVGTTGDSSGVVYFGSDDGVFRAVNSLNTPVGSPFIPFDPQPFRSSPVISENGETVFFGSDNGDFYARRANNLSIIRWTASIGDASRYRSDPVIGRRAGDPDDTVYVGNDNGKLYAFNASTGEVRWFFPTGGAVQSSPALSSDGSVVYIGSSNNILFAINTSDGSERWRFTGASGALESAISVDANGHIYFGSNDNKAYALYADGTLKWSFTTGADVVAKPAVKGDGSVYVGSKDGKLYAINQFTDPKNYKDLRITSTSGVSPVRVGGVPIGGTTVGATGVPVAVDSERDWLKGKSGASPKGPWSVRLEITRSLALANGTYAYNLRAWVRQCNSANCDDALLFDPLGTFFEDTRVQYAPAARPPMIEQTINLSPSDHADFERFIFGFTAQTGASETQTATIRQFQLSFIRPNDPTVDSDPGWP